MAKFIQVSENYFVDEKDTDSKENIFSKQYKKRIVDFLKKALDIDAKNKICKKIKVCPCTC